jgi:hypothetical protein
LIGHCVEVLFESVEALEPHFSVGLHPGSDIAERLPREPINPPGPLYSGGYHSRFAEHPQVLGHCRLRQGEGVDQACDIRARLPFLTCYGTQFVEYAAPSGLNQHMETIHTAHIALQVYTCQGIYVL